MGSVAGASSRSQASVHRVRSCRAGLPVMARDRTKSRDVAARRLADTSGDTSASAVSSQTDPVHTPWAPRAMAASIWRPSAMPPAARTGTSGPTASTTWGTSTMVEISPQWPPASVPWATITSTPWASWRSACWREPTSAPTRRPASWQRSTMYLGGGPSALTTRRTAPWDSVTSSWPGPSSSTLRPAALGTRASVSSGSGGMPASSSTRSTKARCSSGMRVSRCSGVASGPPP